MVSSHKVTWILSDRSLAICFCGEEIFPWKLEFYHGGSRYLAPFCFHFSSRPCFYPLLKILISSERASLFYGQGTPQYSGRKSGKVFKWTALSYMPPSLSQFPALFSQFLSPQKDLENHFSSELLGFLLLNALPLSVASWLGVFTFVTWRIILSRSWAALSFWNLYFNWSNEVREVHSVSGVRRGPTFP